MLTPLLWLDLITFFTLNSRQLFWSRRAPIATSHLPAHRQVQHLPHSPPWGAFDFLCITRCAYLASKASELWSHRPLNRSIYSLRSPWIKASAGTRRNVGFPLFAHVLSCWFHNLTTGYKKGLNVIIIKGHQKKERELRILHKTTPGFDSTCSRKWDSELPSRRRGDLPPRQLL